MNTSDSIFNILMAVAGAAALILGLVNRPGLWKLVGMSPEAGSRMRVGMAAAGAVLLVDNLLTSTGLVTMESPLYMILYVLDGLAIVGLAVLFYRQKKN